MTTPSEDEPAAPLEVGTPTGIVCQVFPLRRSGYTYDRGCWLAELPRIPVRGDLIHSNETGTTHEVVQVIMTLASRKRLLHGHLDYSPAYSYPVVLVKESESWSDRQWFPRQPGQG